MKWSLLLSLLLLARGSSKPIGETLIYEIDPESKIEEKSAGIEAAVAVLERRINPGSSERARIRSIGEGRIEIAVYGKDPQMARRIERLVESPGTLEFRILANRRDHESLLEPARELGPQGRLYDEQKRLQAWWVPVGLGQEDNFMHYIFRTTQDGESLAEYHYDKKTEKGTFRAVEGARLFDVEIPEDKREICIRIQKDNRGHQWFEVLVVKDVYDVTGEYLVGARPSIDQSGRPNVLFTFNAAGGRLFGRLTGENLPDEAQAFTRKLGIILDGRLQSAPSLRSAIFQDGEITGSFTREQVQDLADILNAGSLPVTLKKIEPDEGDDTR
jgi:SecD/SecF fusion protein